MEFVKHICPDRVEFVIIEFEKHMCDGRVRATYMCLWSLPRMMMKFVKHICVDRVRVTRIHEFVKHIYVGSTCPG